MSNETPVHVHSTALSVGKDLRATGTLSANCGRTDDHSGKQSEITSWRWICTHPAGCPLPPRHTLRAAPKLGNYHDMLSAVATIIRHEGQKDGPGCPEGPVSPVDTYSRDALTVCTRRRVTSTHSSAVGVKCEKPPNVYRQNRQVSPYHTTLCSWEKTSTSTRMNHGNTAWS